MVAPIFSLASGLRFIAHDEKAWLARAQLCARRVPVRTGAGRGLVAAARGLKAAAMPHAHMHCVLTCHVRDIE